MQAAAPLVRLFAAAVLLLAEGPPATAQTSKKNTPAPKSPAAPAKKAPSPKKAAPPKAASKSSSKKGAAKSASSKSSSAKKSASASPNRKPTAKRRTTASLARSRRGPSQAKPTPERYGEIQRALQERGYLNAETGGKWDVASVEALKQFQKDQNLPPDGKLSSLSLIALGLGPQRGGAHLPGPQQPASALPAPAPPAPAESTPNPPQESERKQ